jgi:hypothetical protein
MHPESPGKPQPAMEKIQRSRMDSADLLLLEARTAEAYLDIAQRSLDAEVYRRSVARVRRALTAMTYFLAESSEEQDAQIIRRVRDDLRVRLNAFTRVAPAHIETAKTQRPDILD